MRTKSPAPFLIAAFVLFIATLLTRALLPEPEWAWMAVAGLFVADLVWFAIQYRQALRSRTVAYSLNTVVTIILVLAIVGVVNFVAYRYPFKKDLTKNKIHTLSDQTVKVLKGLRTKVQANFFGKMDFKDNHRPLLERMKAVNPDSFAVEFVDPDRELSRVKAAGITKGNTLQLVVTTSGKSRDVKVEEPSEEKVTNALIKLTKERPPTLCSIIGHGERSIADTGAEGYDRIRKELGDQSYEVKEISIVQEGKIPPSCDAIAVLGARSAWFAPEIKALEDYLDGGGRALIALDVNVKGVELSQEMKSILAKWYIDSSHALIVDPVSRQFQVDASAPIVAGFNKEHPITRDFRTNNACSFPFTRPLKIMPGAPQGLALIWLVQTTPYSWAASDFKQMATGQIAKKEGDPQGPLVVGVAAEGKLNGSKAARSTRLVAFGTSLFATNNAGRFGGNTDLFLNAVAWVLEDESMISIRTREDQGGRIELTQKSGTLIFYLTVIILPILIAAGGVTAWVIRRRM